MSETKNENIPGKKERPIDSSFLEEAEKILEESKKNFGENSENYKELLKNYKEIEGQVNDNKKNSQQALEELKKIVEGNKNNSLNKGIKDKKENKPEIEKKEVFDNFDLNCSLHGKIRDYFLYNLKKESNQNKTLYDLYKENNNGYFKDKNINNIEKNKDLIAFLKQNKLTDFVENGKLNNNKNDELSNVIFKEFENKNFKENNQYKDINYLNDLIKNRWYSVYFFSKELKKEIINYYFHEGFNQLKTGEQIENILLLGENAGLSESDLGKNYDTLIDNIINDKSKKEYFIKKGSKKNLTYCRFGSRFSKRLKAINTSGFEDIDEILFCIINGNKIYSEYDYNSNFNLGLFDIYKDINDNFFNHLDGVEKILDILISKNNISIDFELIKQINFVIEKVFQLNPKNKEGIQKIWNNLHLDEVLSIKFQDYYNNYFNEDNNLDSNFNLEDILKKEKYTQEDIKNIDKYFFRDSNIENQMNNEMIKKIISFLMENNIEMSQFKGIEKNFLLHDNVIWGFIDIGKGELPNIYSYIDFNDKEQFEKFIHILPQSIKLYDESIYFILNRAPKDYIDIYLEQIDLNNLSVLKSISDYFKNFKGSKEELPINEKNYKKILETYSNTIYKNSKNPLISQRELIDLKEGFKKFIKKDEEFDRYISGISNYSDKFSKSNENKNKIYQDFKNIEGLKDLDKETIDEILRILNENHENQDDRCCVIFCSLNSLLKSKGFEIEKIKDIIRLLFEYDTDTKNTEKTIIKNDLKKIIPNFKEIEKKEDESKEDFIKRALEEHEKQKGEKLTDEEIENIKELYNKKGIIEENKNVLNNFRKYFAYSEFCLENPDYKGTFEDFKNDILVNNNNIPGVKQFLYSNGDILEYKSLSGGKILLEGIEITKSDLAIVKRSPEAKDNLINFYKLLNDLGLYKLGKYKDKILSVISDVYTGKFDANDKHYVSEKEVKVFLICIAKSLGFEINSKDNIDKIKYDILRLNKAGITGKVVSNNYEKGTTLEKGFINTFDPNNTGFRVFDFRRSISSMNLSGI